MKSNTMLKAIILDFNGVILDDELLHYKAMQKVVAVLDITLTKEAYWGKYLPLDDTDCLEAVCRDNSIPLTDERRAHLLELKNALYNQQLQNRFPLFPGAAEFIQSAAQNYPLALASGARREEIETTLKATGLNQYFHVIVAAEDFTLGKPHPESYLLALKRLNAARKMMSSAISPEECLVIEDTIGGVAGAIAAGMRCLAVSNSYPPEKLQKANRVARSLKDVKIESLPALFEQPS
jgi:beta-phosphoglucomutase